MALHFPKATLLHSALANISHEVATVDNIITTPARLPTELLLIIRTHLLNTLTTHHFLESTRALAEYEAILQRLLCPDCISYNHDIYGPDIWQWQQFSGPCNCVQKPSTSPNPPVNPQQFSSPYHWLEHHLSLQAAQFYPASSSSSPPPIWDVVTDVLHRYHCEPLKEDLDDFQRSPPSPSGITIFYYRRAVDYYGYLRQSQIPPTIRVRPVQSSLRLLESNGIGDPGDMGDAFRTEIILRQACRELGFSLELKDVFSSPRESASQPLSWSLRKQDSSSEIPPQKFSLRFSSSPVFHGAFKTYSFLSAVLGAFFAIPMTIATIALTVICFYSRPVALRVGV
ncbi:hypothetical protein P691DRAFT_807939 [Macrolepiota fuliginosa MF-IS2]|uniref:Uncharacterized protein n=1 Tax=Macrolepiota fuliginosa MF-IS2 TaxID=1400762 RepID=A0A9P5XIL0_9AGAR|nr:hypothetical protein P691DRAFT_807939 [Macrolepiota fuliginosa MF-IS2]